MSYLTSKYKGIYRILPDLDQQTNSFPIDCDGSRDEDMVYIACNNDNKIMYWGNGILIGYVSTLMRGRNIKREMKKQKIEFFDYDESSEEVMFKFKAKDMEHVAEIMKAKTYGASIAPFSSKNLPKNKDIKIPNEEVEKYKSISSKVDKKDMLKFKTWNSNFLNDVLQKKIRKDTKNKSYNYKTDMQKMMLSRQTKEFIYAKGLWQEYLDYLSKEIEDYYAQSYHCWVKKL